MNNVRARQLASDIIARCKTAPDFFDALKEFDERMDDYPEEYAYALKAALAQRIPAEDEAFRERALGMLARLKIPVGAEA